MDFKLRADVFPGKTPKKFRKRACQFEATVDHSRNLRHFKQ